MSSESLGVKLSDYELGFHEKVLKAYIPAASDANEARTAFADEIEAEDLRLQTQREKKKKMCCVS